MRKPITHPHREYEERIVSQFLWLETTLLLPRDERTEYSDRESRWLERAYIVQSYSFLCGRWMDRQWASAAAVRFARLNGKLVGEPTMARSN